MRTITLFSCLALAACQPTAKPVVSASGSAAPPVRGPTDAFTQSYAAGIGDLRRQLQQLGLATEWAAVRVVVDRYLGAGHPLPGAGDAALLRGLRVDSTTNSLLLYGYRSAHLADAEQARLIVEAADFSRPTTSADVVILAPTVLIANTEGVREAADGSRRLAYRVIEPLKNAPPEGTIISLTLSGPRPPSPVPPPPLPGEEDLGAPGIVVLALSPPRPVGDALGAGDTYARMGLLRIEGDTVLPSYHSGAPETTLARIREAIRKQVCAPGFVPLGAVRGRSVAC